MAIVLEMDSVRSRDIILSLSALINTNVCARPGQCTLQTPTEWPTPQDVIGNKDNKTPSS